MSWRTLASGERRYDCFVTLPGEVADIVFDIRERTFGCPPPGRIVAEAAIRGLAGKHEKRLDVLIRQLAFAHKELLEKLEGKVDESAIAQVRGLGEDIRRAERLRGRSRYSVEELSLVPRHVLEQALELAP